MERRGKTGILGGTFNPIHIGHLIIAQKAKETYNLDKVLFMPSKTPPHKDVNKIAPDFIRKEMVLAAIEGNPGFEFSDVELTREGIIYTADTLKYLTELYPNDDFYFIMGADSLLAIESWHEPERIFSLCSIIVADRNDKLNEMNEKKIYLQNKYEKCDLLFLDCPMIDISSTYIRNAILKMKSIKYFVPPKVEDIIKRNNLYTSD